MLTTEIVTATAQAMIADETIVVTSGAGTTVKAPIVGAFVSLLVATLLGLARP